MAYQGPDRRKDPRISARFIVSYRILREQDNVDVSQTKNISLGGMLLTTNRAFQPGTNLVLEIRLPFDLNPIMLMGEVLESREVTKDLIYDTRLQLLKIDEKHKDTISKTVNYYVRRQTDKG